MSKNRKKCMIQENGQILKSGLRWILFRNAFSDTHFVMIGVLYAAIFLKTHFKFQKHWEKK